MPPEAPTEPHDQAHDGGADGEITPAMLLQAYRAGIFPMAPHRDSEALEWYCPQERGLLPLQAPGFPRRLLRTVLAGAYEVCTDRDFPAMMAACATPAPGREESWISPRIRRLYTELFALGHAHSVELRSREGELLGGLYGVAIGGAFFGESMMSRVRDASKIALVHLVAALRQGGYTLLDTQYVTPHLARMGGVSVLFPRYRALLETALRQPAVWPGDVSLQALGGEIRAMKVLCRMPG
ncbi:leucyl/phenylalanyl-tRNA--protein transferase [Oecophyllibacter saccharovorans]|uniref:leucyl/phenylalanyl-tRNA--protein transferase n=1 Tax=Oecophyllibacter saccharovorans TaxID=2558360 RepID=UPI001169CB49|nr:leucyl/phenylalanyl-tRNA--protein transferase [Oecophyllibacter saccharovorans]